MDCISIFIFIAVSTHDLIIFSNQKEITWAFHFPSPHSILWKYALVLPGIQKTFGNHMASKIESACKQTNVIHSLQGNSARNK